MDARDRLIRLLADARFHSGSALAEALGVSRSAVWKQAHRLGDLGLEVETAGRRGYRLKSKLDLLDGAAIIGCLDEEARRACESLTVDFVVNSTNVVLASQQAPAVGRWRAVLAEFQTGGRGRRNRRWISPFGTGLCMSLGWSFASAPRDLPALSLAAGIGVIRALEATGASGLMLKWPNDIMVDGAKLGGVLVDIDGDSRGPLRAIIGVGVNLTMSQTLVSAVTAEGGLAPGALDRVVPTRQLERNPLAAAVIGSLYHTVNEFEGLGFAPFADEWRRRDHLFGQPLVVRRGAEEICGVGCGLGADGALLIERPEGVAAVFSGDVTVRAHA